jgi:hypothetical protein
MSKSETPKFLDGELVPLADFMRDQFGRCEMTGKRWARKPDGLPTIKIGNFEFVHPPTAREWFLRHMRQRNPRRQQPPEQPNAA